MVGQRIARIRGKVRASRGSRTRNPRITNLFEKFWQIMCNLPVIDVFLGTYGEIDTV
jgi:hypothetical protein